MNCKDGIGRSIAVGDMVAHAITCGSSMYWDHGIVTKVNPKSNNIAIAGSYCNRSAQRCVKLEVSGGEVLPHQYVPISVT